MQHTFGHEYFFFVIARQTLSTELNQNGHAIVALICKMVVSSIAIAATSISSKIPILRSLINHTPRLEELNLDLRKVALGSHHWSESACCLWQAKAETAPSIFTLRLKDVIDRKYSCLAEIYCPALEAPFRGLIAPTICTDKRSNIRRSTVCSYGCDSGHNLVGGSQSLVCQLNGLWQGTVPYCKRRFFIAYEMNN